MEAYQRLPFLLEPDAKESSCVHELTVGCIPAGVQKASSSIPHHQYESVLPCLSIMSMHSFHISLIVQFWQLQIQIFKSASERLLGPLPTMFDYFNHHEAPPYSSRSSVCNCKHRQGARSSSSVYAKYAHLESTRKERWLSASNVRSRINIEYIAAIGKDLKEKFIQWYEQI